jgi:DNA-directed RNA polymerase beta' subunit
MSQPLFIDESSEYRIRLMSDTELERYASVIYNNKNVNNSQLYNIESGIFGANKHAECTICGQRSDKCPGHYGLISLPYPVITNTIIAERFLKLIQLICPCCSNFPIENASDALSIIPQNRFKFIKDEVQKKQKNVINTCPYCKQQFMFIKVEGNLPNIKFMFRQEAANKSVQLNPIYIYSILQNMSDQTCEYAGFNIASNDPRNYMTKYITIIPNKLRIKTIDSSSSSTTASYKNIIDVYVSTLNKLYQTSIHSAPIIPDNKNGEDFNAAYTSLLARYILILDMTRESLTNACLEALSKRDKQHLEPSASLIGRLKDKDNSYFEKGIMATRHMVSARTVLGADTACHAYEVGFPQKYCNKMGHWIPVYAENLELMKQFVASMSELARHDYSTIRANKVMFSGKKDGKHEPITPTKALTIAAKIQPGDKLFVSLIPGSIVQHCRFPSVREESIASHMINPTHHTCMTLPIAACEYKNADFDGDETGIYVNNSHVSDIECLLLNSIFRQIINHKYGTVGVLYQGYDSKLEIPMIKADTLIGVVDIRDKSHNLLCREPFYPPKTAGQFVEKFLDYITGNSETLYGDLFPPNPNNPQEKCPFSKIPKINYVDGSTIIIDNKLDSQKCQLNNQNLYKYLITTIGADRVLDFIDAVIQLGYNYSYYTPFTLGNEIKYYSPEIQKQVEARREADYQRMRKIEQSNKSQYDKDLEKYNIYQEQKLPIQDLLKENIKGTNVERTKLLKNMGCYYNMIVGMDSAIVNDTLPHPTLNNYTRTCSAFPQHSTDPMAYGYAKHGYISNETKMTETFFDCMMQRHALYIKGNGVAKQGYLQKRFLMAFGQNLVDANGGVVFDNQFVSPCYGSMSINPRLLFEQPLKDVSLPEDEFIKKYCGSNKQSSKIYEMYKLINEAGKMYSSITEFIKRKTYKDTFIAGYDFEQLLQSEIHSGNVKPGVSNPKDIEEFIVNVEKIFAPPGMKQRYCLLNLAPLEYYFLQKATEFNIPRKTFLKLYHAFLNSLADAGEPVGMKATLSIGEALTQESLDAIHHASQGNISVDKLQRTIGGDRFEELVGGSIHKNSVITLGFYDSTKEKVEEFAKREETIYFPEIWTKLETIINTKICDDVKQLHPKIANEFDKLEVSNTFIKMIWNLSTLGDYDIPLSSVFNSLYSHFEDISFITGTPVNSKEFVAYIYFNKATTVEKINNIIQQFKNKTRESIIHGDCIKNCFITQNANTGEWILRCNETNPRIRAYEKIIYRPEVDPAKCYTTNTKLCLDMYGVFETGARVCEELLYASVELSCVGAVPPRHMKTIGLGCLSSGQFFMAVSTSAFKSNIDYLRGCNFEQPTAFIRKAITEGEFKKVEDTVAGAFFADAPKSGSGYSRVEIFKN